MEKHSNVRPIDPDEFPPTRPGIRTAVSAIAVACGAALLYFWPVIKPVITPYFRFL